MWQRRDTAAAWASANPVLAAGEIGVELGANPVKFKVGDGVRAWVDLPYQMGSAIASGSLVPGEGVTLEGELENRLVGAGDVVIGAVAGSRIESANIPLTPLGVAASAGPKKAVWFAPYDGAFRGAFLGLDLAASSGSTVADVQSASGVSVLGTKPAAEAGQTVSGDAVFVPASIGFARGEKYVFGLDSVGVGSQGVSMVLLYAQQAAPPPTGSTVSLCHFDGTNGSISIYDSASDALWDREGGATIGTDQSRFGSGSLRFATGIVSAVTRSSPDFVLGAEDYTFEFWLRMPSPGNRDNNLLYWGADSAAGNPPAGLYLRGGRFPTVWAGTDRILSATDASGTAFVHLAVTRQSGIARLFVNGVKEATEWSDGSNYSGSTIKLGKFASGNQITVGCHIDEFRVLKGVAAYTGTFVPPSAPFTL